MLFIYDYDLKKNVKLKRNILKIILIYFIYEKNNLLQKINQ